MTQRERHAPSALPEATPPSASGHPATPRPAPAADATERLPLWDDIYRHATPAQQGELLALARRQGVIYAHQLPPTTNGTSGEQSRHLLARLLAGKTEDLGPVRPAPVDAIDDRLDEVQREAVARALATPDICLVQGLPGTGKSTVSAEIVRHAVRRGERVLLLGATAASINRVLELTAGQEDVCAVRCVAPGEHVEALPPAMRELTVTARCRAHRETTIPAAFREIDLAGQRRDRRRQDEEVLRQLGELAETWAGLEGRAACLGQARESLPAEVECAAAAAETDGCTSGPEMCRSLAAALHGRHEALARVEAAEADLRKRREELQRDEDALAPELKRLHPLGEAKQQGRWWTWTWWQATFAGNVPARLADLEKQCRTIETSLTALEEEKQRLDAERARADQSYRQERACQVEAEKARRTARLDEEAAALEQDRKLVWEKWQLRCRELSAGTEPPAAPTAEAVAAARQAWSRQLERDEQQIASARQWAAGLESQADGFAGRLVEHANLVASGPGIGADGHFGDASGISFDLLLVEEAQYLTESEFLAVARRARRWVLVGEPEPEGLARSSLPARPDRSQRPRSVAAAHGPGLSPRLFQRLWQCLHFDPRTLPYAWEREGDRLCCRLRALTAEQRQWLECERVADFPDIELRILVPPRAKPVLAEVVFPPSMSICQAKEYIFRELQELPVRARFHSLRWREEADRLVLHMANGDSDGAVAVDLGSGVRELVGGARGNGSIEAGAWHTCRLEFDRHAGWLRSAAEEWVERHIGARDLGRTVRLDVPYRMHPELAAVLSQWLFAGAYHLPQTAAADNLLPAGAPVQFVPVPPAAEVNGVGKRDSGRRGRAPRGGAGLELDLSDPRHRDRLPSDVRPQLPAQGLVNYLEAQAVVRALEKLAASGTGKPVAAVVALYPAQAELIRCLVRRSHALASGALAVQVDVPDAFRERECTIVLVSLTRSHHHRAVTFGESPHQLMLALTRARSRLVLFGDPGTLARRVQWEGAVDHLDAASAAWERDLLSHLVRSFPDHGDPVEAVAVHEGTRT